MKRKVLQIISFLIIWALLLSVIAPTLGFAKEVNNHAVVGAEKAEFYVTSVKGVANKDVTVEVRVSEESNIASLGLQLNFDSSKLLVTDYEVGSLLESGMTAINANISDKIIASYVSMDPLVDGGTLFSVSFMITNGEINEDLDLSLSVTEATDLYGNSVVSMSEDGNIEVVDILYGDVDSNNRITAVDALKILRATTEEVELADNELKAADVNGDAKVTVTDALQVLYYSAELLSDFAIYQLVAPQNVVASDIQEYEFTISWDSMKYVLGYNVYLDGNKINDELIIDNYVTIGGDNGSKYIAPKIHNYINHNTEYKVEITAVNSLKESEKCNPVEFKTKRAYSYVTFKDWDGTVIGSSQRVLYGDDAVVPNDPKREGYVFIGWDKETTEIYEDTVITALYEIARYDYVFYDWNKEEIYRQNIIHGGTVTPPTDPTREGYEFVGWYSSTEDGKEVTDFSNITENTNVYARYKINTYYVFFESLPGERFTEIKAQYNAKVSTPNNPTRFGYSFDGWYKDPSCNQKWIFTSDTVAGDTTLYAKWKPVTITIDKSELSFNHFGASAQLHATITGGDDYITWYSDNTSIATVDSMGNVSAMGNGTTTIYIKGSSSERRPVCKVTVALEKRLYITAEIGVNLRSSASTSSAAILCIPFPAAITAYGERFSANGRNDWLKVNYNGHSGYIAGTYTSEYQPAAPKATNNSYTGGTSTSGLSGSLSSRLVKAQQLMPNGYYWRGKKGNSSSDYMNVSKSIKCDNGNCGAGDGVCVDGGWAYCNHNNGYCTGYGCHRCGIFLVNGTQRLSCAGYAWAVSTYVNNGKIAKSVGVTEVKAGDIVQYSTGTDFGHYIYITQVYTSNGKTYYKYTDANGTGSQYGNCNQIRWDVTIAKGSIRVLNVFRV